MSKGPGYTEFKLKLNAASVTDLQHHVLILNSTSLGLSDMTSPMRLFREKKERTADNEGADDEAEGADDGSISEGISSRRQNRRRSRIISLDKKKRIEEDEELTQEPCWVLEDADAQHTFVGRREGGQQSNYVFFVNQGRDFLVVPAAQWYRFNPKPAYRPLTTEEAETQMAARGKNRLILAQQLQKSRQISPVSATTNTAIDDSLESSKVAMAASESVSANKLKALRESMVKHQEELDYDEIFDDDEGDAVNMDGIDGSGEAFDEDDPSAPKPVIRLSRPAQKLSLAGRSLGKLMHSLDRKIVDYRKSDEERDPYANSNHVSSSSSFENDDGDEEDGNNGGDGGDKEKGKSSTASRVPQLPSRHAAIVRTVSLSRPASLPLLTTQASVLPGASAIDGNVVAPLSSQRAFTSSLNSPERTAATSTKRSASDLYDRTSTTTSSQPPKLSSSFPADNPLRPESHGLDSLTKEKVISMLRNGPVRTKDLINALRDKLKSESAKTAFKDIIKQVATVKSGTSDDEKWLELRPDYAHAK